MTNKVYDIVADQIINALDNNVVPWRRPWALRGGDIARNRWNKPYRGINVFLLSMEKMLKGYSSNFWMTYNQVEKLGGRVREGEKSTFVIFWKLFEVESKNEMNETTKKRIPVLRYFRVFNLDQTHDVKLTRAMKAESEPQPEGIEFNPLDDAEAIMSTYLAREDAPRFVEGGNVASYQPKTDVVTVPRREQFSTPEEYYSTVFHEFSHSTGHTDRVGRKGIMEFDHFGSGQYGEEEFVAELTAAFGCADAGIDNTRDNSVAYIQGWSAKIKADKQIVVKAAAAAQKAWDFISDYQYEANNEDDD